MSLEELKKDWNSLEHPMSPTTLTHEKLRTIIKTKYYSYITKTSIIELFFLILFLYFIALTTFRFDALEKNYLEGIAIACLVLLGILFILRSIRLLLMFRNGYLSYSHTVALKGMIQQKISTQRFYYLNIILGFGLIIMLVTINLKIYSEYELIQNKYFWYILIPGSLMFIILVNNWIRKHHTKAIKECQDLLKELG